MAGVALKPPTWATASWAAAWAPGTWEWLVGHTLRTVGLDVFATGTAGLDNVR